MNFIQEYFSEVSDVAQNICEDSIEQMVLSLSSLREARGRLFILGVGGSAGNASHAVNDFRKLCCIDAHAPTDNSSEITARTNDDGFNTIFSEYIKVSCGSAKDAILIFSVGGGSEEKGVSVNLIAAIREAKKRGMKIFSIVGMKNGFAVLNSDISLVVPIKNPSLITPISESFQAVIWHCIVSHPQLAVNTTKW
tara:strand:+ start:731 stop:1315 length:585 start_codon:yes stop_codon:yes gene_type:complete